MEGGGSSGRRQKEVEGGATPGWDRWVSEPSLEAERLSSLCGGFVPQTLEEAGQNENKCIIMSLRQNTIQISLIHVVER